MSASPVLIMAGGTGGHVFPALSVAEELRAREVPVVWLGTRRGIEARLVPQAGIEIEWLPVGGLRGKGVLRWLAAPFGLLRAVARARRIIRRRGPRAVLGMGGYAAGPGGLAAYLGGVPLVIHEQNALAGLTNRSLARFARRVLCAFDGAFDARVRAEVVGNPVRPQLFSLPDPKLRFGDGATRCNLLVLGGSQGAETLNRLVPEALARLPEALRPHVRHQAGERTLEVAQDAYASHGVQAQVLPFIDDMADAYGWAHLVVCRSGALTVSELAAAGCAAVLLPYRFAVDDHQSVNGQVLVQAGAACMIRHEQLDAQSLAEQLQQLLGEPSRLRQMAEAARTQAKPGAAARVADAVLAEGERR